MATLKHKSEYVRSQLSNRFFMVVFLEYSSADPASVLKLILKLSEHVV